MQSYEKVESKTKESFIFFALTEQVPAHGVKKQEKTREMQMDGLIADKLR